MTKFNISLLLGVVTLVTVFAGLILRFGPLPQAVAVQARRIDRVERRVTRADRRLIKQGVDLEYVKKNTDSILSELKALNAPYRKKR